MLKISNKALWTGAAIVLLSGCTTTKSFVNTITSESYDYSELYLRGSFTWWEAEEKYKVVPFEDDTYRVTVSLVADGQPYDFKFADKGWSEGLSCGYLNKEKDEQLSLTDSVSANCNTPVDNFIFVPDESGDYIFEIDFSSWGPPQVSVKKL